MTCDAVPGGDEADFEGWAEEALASLPRELRDAMSNVVLVLEDEPPPGLPLLGLYRGLPDKITIYRGPLERLYGGDRARLRNEVRRVVLHEIAHHFGIGDDRLRELGRY